MDSFFYNSKFDQIKAVICISTKQAFKSALLWGWKIFNKKTVLYVL